MVGETYVPGGKDKEAAAREREDRLNSARNKVSRFLDYVTLIRAQRRLNTRAFD